MNREALVQPCQAGDQGLLLPHMLLVGGAPTALAAAASAVLHASPPGPLQPGVAVVATRAGGAGAARAKALI